MLPSGGAGGSSGCQLGPRHKDFVLEYTPMLHYVHTILATAWLSADADYLYNIIIIMCLLCGIITML